MPELPEVETTRRGIEPHIKHRVISRVIVRQRKLRWPVPKNLNRLLVGNLVEDVQRRAKYLLLNIEANGCQLGVVIIHLGMSGSLRMINAQEPPMAHDHIDIVLDDGMALRYTDPRRFGCVLWHAAKEKEPHTLLASLGPEPLLGGFDGEILFQRSRGRKIAVKSLLMDNKIVVGVGNIYANEALFSAGIRPDRAAGKISRGRYEDLAIEVKRVLAEAIEQGGTTLRDFVGGDGKPGYFKQALKVYGRGELPCVTCKKPLIEIRLGQRSTVYCNNCQR